MKKMVNLAIGVMLSLIFAGGMCFIVANMNKYDTGYAVITWLLECVGVYCCTKLMLPIDKKQQEKCFRIRKRESSVIQLPM